MDWPARQFKSNCFACLVSRVHGRVRLNIPYFPCTLAVYNAFYNASAQAVGEAAQPIDSALHFGLFIGGGGDKIEFLVCKPRSTGKAARLSYQVQHTTRK